MFHWVLLCAEHGACTLGLQHLRGLADFRNRKIHHFFCLHPFLALLVSWSLEAWPPPVVRGWQHERWAVVHHSRGVAITIFSLCNEFVNQPSCAPTPCPCQCLRMRRCVVRSKKQFRPWSACVIMQFFLSMLFMRHAWNLHWCYLKLALESNFRRKSKSACQPISLSKICERNICSPLCIERMLWICSCHNKIEGWGISGGC